MNIRSRITSDKSLGLLLEMFLKCQDRALGYVNFFIIIVSLFAEIGWIHVCGISVSNTKSLGLS